MTSRFRLVAALTMTALLAGAGAALAAKPAARAIPLTGSPIGKVAIGSPSLDATCTLGVSTGAAYIIDYIAPPDDAYYTLLDPASCACPANAVQINAAHLLLNFQAGCTQRVQVRVVPAVLSAPGCYVPDPSSTVCGPTFYDLTPGAAGNYQFNLGLSVGCCITAPAFLEITFPQFGAGCDQVGTRPRLITTGACTPCTSYNVYGGLTDDLCDVVGFPGNPVMWADGDCCSATPTEHGTWGQVKILYR